MDAGRRVLKLILDRAHGRTAIDLGTGPLRLRPPTFREWAEYSIEWEEQAAAITDAGVMVYVETGTVASVGGIPWEDSPYWSGVVDLNRRILTTLGAPLRDADDLPLGDRAATAALLTHWRDYPLSPWDADRAPERNERSNDKRKIIRSNIRGVRGAVSVIYRALSRHSPSEIDRLELWQVASLLGRDDPDEAEDEDPIYAGARTRYNTRGNREQMTWGRHPSQRFLFTRPPAVTIRPRNF